MKQDKNYERKWNNYITKAILSMFVFCLVLLSNCKVAFAKVPSKISDKTYALKVQTGAKAGTNSIKEFVIEYKGTDGKPYRSYINLADGDYSKSVDLMRKVSATGASELQKRQDIVANSLGYKIIPSQSASDKKDDTSKKDTSNEIVVSSDALSSNGEDTYFFEAYSEIESITSVGVITNAKKGSSASWSCKGVSISKIGSVSGMGMYGYISNSYYMDMSETILYQSNKSEQITASGSKLVTLSKGTVEQKNKKKSNSKYMIKVDIADEYKAGLEAYITNSHKPLSTKMFPAEFLVLDVMFEDEEGAQHQVYMPVLTSALAYAIETGGNGLSNAELIDMVSQGGSLAFEANFPNLKEIKSTNLYYVNSETALKEFGLDSNDKCTEKRSSYYSAMSGDAVKISKISIYEGANSVKVSGANNNAQILASSSAAPVYCYTAPSAGLSLSPGGATDIDFAREERTILEDNNWYVIQIKTSDRIDSAGTKDDIDLSLIYTNSGGKECSLKVDLREAAKKFYGFWPRQDMINGATELDYYEVGMAKGGTLFGLIQADDARQFINMNIGKKGDDDWLGTSISVYELSEAAGGLGQIQAEWIGQNEIMPSDINTFRFRTVNGVSLNFGSGQDLGTPHRIFNIAPQGNGDTNDADSAYGIYVDGNTETSIDFSSEEISVIDDNTADVFENYYDMNYDTAMGNFGFQRSKIQYDVAVHVGEANDKEASKKDDGGSDNFFYFQLVFEAGKSAYVQANQQLYSDGFRAGETEHFTISVNRDYGAVREINIVPEVDPDIGSPYDKLKIDSIEVTRPGSTGLSTVYKVSTVGWIGIDYSDNEADRSHAEKDICKNYKIDDVSTSATIMFLLTTDVYPMKDGKINQFAGSVYATIHYVDNAGKEQTDNLDVVEKMYEFDGLSQKDVQTDKSGRMMSNSKYMFRSGSVDRFLWNVSDIKKITSIELKVSNQSDEAVTWGIKSVTACLLTKGSILRDRAVNSFGEFVIKDCTYIRITDSVSSYTAQIGSKNAQESPIQIAFNDTKGDVITPPEASSVPYIMKRDTTSENDKLNLYAYVSADAVGDTKRGVRGSVVYEDVSGQIVKNTVSMNLMSQMTSSGKPQYIYYFKEMSGKQFNSLMETCFKATDSSTANPLPISHVIVEQVRDNVIIGSYKLTFGEKPGNIANPEVKEAKTTTRENILVQGDRQSVTIQFGDEMEAVKELVTEEMDLAMSIRYRTTTGSVSDVFDTEPLFLTKCGVDSIHPGDVVTFDMFNPNVHDIVGVTFYATSFLKVNIDKMTIGTYTMRNDNTAAADMSKSDDQKDSDKSTDKKETKSNYECTGWYSFDINSDIKNEKKDFGPTCTERNSAETISPVTFNIATLDSFTGVADPGLDKDKSVYMNISYKHGEEDKMVEIQDLNKYVVSGDFTAGKTATACVLLKGVQYDKLTSITLCPKDKDDATNLSWAVDSIRVNFGDGQSSSDERYVSLKRLFTENDTEGKNTISFARIGLESKLFRSTSLFEYVPEEEAVSSAAQGKPGKADLDCDSDTILLGIKTDLTNSTLGYKITADEGGRGKFEVVSDEDGLAVIRISGKSGISVTRTVTISSIENPDCFITFTITVNFGETGTITIDDPGINDANDTLPSEDVIDEDHED